MFRIVSRCQNKICRNYVTSLHHVIAWRDRMWPVLAKTLSFTVKSVMGKNVQNWVYMSKYDLQKSRHTIALRNCMAWLSVTGFRKNCLGYGKKCHGEKCSEKSGDIDVRIRFAWIEVTVLQHVILWRGRTKQPNFAKTVCFTAKTVIGKKFRIRSECQNNIRRNYVTVSRHVIARRYSTENQVRT